MIRVVSVNVARASLRRIGEAQVLTAIGKRTWFFRFGFPSVAINDFISRRQAPFTP